MDNKYQPNLKTSKADFNKLRTLFRSARVLYLFNLKQVVSL